MPGRSRRMSRSPRWSTWDRRDEAGNTRGRNGHIVGDAIVPVACLPRSGQSQVWERVAVSSDLSFALRAPEEFSAINQARSLSFPSATISLRATFRIFPLGVSGNASVRKYLVGILYLAIRLAQ